MKYVHFVCWPILLILPIVQDVKRNRSDCIQLANRALAIINILAEKMTGKWDSASPTLKENIDQFET